MKWLHKGHEFDKFTYLSGGGSNKIYIYGAGKLGTELFNRMKFIKKRIIFIDEEVKDLLYGCEVIHPSNLDEEMLKNSLLIVCASPQNEQIIIKNMMRRKIIKDVRLVFTYNEFVQLILPIFLFYAENVLYVPDCTILLTERCSLKCRDCAPMYSYLKNPQHRSYESILKDIDGVFSECDYVFDLILTGGEPFLYPKIFDVITYLFKQYENKFDHIQIITNGSIIPNEEIWKLLKKFPIEISLSDYREHIKRQAYINNVEKFTSKLDELKVCHQIINVSHWVDFGWRKHFPNKPILKDMERYFDNCDVTCRAYFNGKWVYCLQALYAEYALKGAREWDENNDNYYSGVSRVELMEWLYGFNDKGYLEMCKYCDGYITTNKNFVSPAIQRNT